MHRGICKLCGATFWETSPGARGEDLCDNHMGKNEFVFLRSPPKPVIPVNERKMAQSRPLLSGQQQKANKIALLSSPLVGQSIRKALASEGNVVVVDMEITESDLKDYEAVRKVLPNRFENRAPSKDKREETSPGTPEDIRDTENNTGETSEE